LHAASVAVPSHNAALPAGTDHDALVQPDSCTFVQAAAYAEAQQHDLPFALAAEVKHPLAAAKPERYAEAVQLELVVVQQPSETWALPESVGHGYLPNLLRLSQLLGHATSCHTYSVADARGWTGCFFLRLMPSALLGTAGH